MRIKKKLKLKIINLPWIERRFITSTKIDVPFFPPIGTTILTSYLRKAGFNVEQDDLNIKVYHHNRKGKTIDLSMFLNEERVISGLREGNDPNLQDCVSLIMSLTDLDNYDVILLSNPVIWNISSSALGLFIAKELKNKGLPVIMGGRGTYAAEILSRKANLSVVDYFLTGFGMHKLSLILKNFECYQKIEPIDAKPPFPAGAVDDIIYIPDFDGLPLDLYRWTPDTRLLDKGPGEYADKGILILPYTFLFGCPYRCAYCYFRLDGFQLKSPNVVVREITELMKKYKTRYFYFHNSLINFSKDYIEELCDLIIKNKLNILWSDSARADKLSKELLKKMRKAGCIRLIYGIDSGSQKVLDYLHKDIEVDEMANILEWTHNAGIWCSINVIVGSPFETEEDFGLTVGFIKENLNYIDEMALFPFILVHSDLSINAEEFGVENLKLQDPFFETYTFDEKKGLKWGSKRKQTQQFYNRMISLFPNLTTRLWLEEFHYLCFLYSVYENKREIQEAYSRIVKRFYRSLVLDWGCLKSKITSLQGLCEISSRIKGVMCR